MRVCEVCGREEEMENQENESMMTSSLHLCENCQHDRQFHSMGNDSSEL
ncbi:hypothetical protein ACFOU2_17400 [Bacillus songklensis]|uniref:Uncharacterized protein n=1 Tax=Bacillus songklensis TaxID=1069116 RepID=A0ABV8B7I2_9BACI